MRHLSCWVVGFVCLGIAMSRAAPVTAAIPERISRPNQLVDIWWQNYRKLPAAQRSCAKICEPIDYRAADHENTAFAFQAARLKPGLTSAQRHQLSQQEIYYFSLRNKTVDAFKKCLYAVQSRSAPWSVRRDGPLQGQCVLENAQTLWDDWCKSFDDFANKTLLPIFRKAYSTAANNNLRPNTKIYIEIPIKVYADGRRDVLKGNFFGISPKYALQISEKVNAFKFSPFPSKIANIPASETFKFNWWANYTGTQSNPFVTLDTNGYTMDCSRFYKYDQLK